MKGEEASIFALCDGATYRLLVSSQDHKRAFDGDTGPNTGGMGAYAPAPVVTPDILEEVERTILRRTLDGMAAEGAPYTGCLYAGVMIGDKGPRVVEFNCRFGDPETQAVLPLFDGDLAEVMLACAKGELAKADFSTSDGYALCVVVASGGYPGHYLKGREITGLDKASEIEGAMVFHAGTKREGKSVVTAGGRVFGVTGWGGTFTEARDRAYRAAGCIAFDGAFHRNDIGHRAFRHFDR
jgi:phosphoribosylamine--glycine ligase